MFIIYVIFAVLVFLQSAIFSHNLLFAAILSLCFLRINKNSPMAVFFLGILFDTINVGVLGASSLAYLMALLLIYFYKLKFETRNLLHIFPLGVFLLLFYSFVFDKNLNISKIVIESSALIIFYLLFSFLVQEKEIVYEKK